MPDDSEAKDRPKVGYRNPPAIHQFKKGQSGNVLGRPPKSSTRAADRSPLGKAYLAEAQRKLRITEAGKISELKTIEIAVRRQSMAAVGGDLKAQREFVAGYGLRSATSVHEMTNCSMRRSTTSRFANGCQTITKSRVFSHPGSTSIPTTLRPMFQPGLSR